MENKKILITGGAGFIGSNLAAALCDNNEVIVLDNLSTGSEDNIQDLKVDFRQGDTLEVAEKVPEKVDLIFHLGMTSSTPLYREDRSLVGQNIGGSIEIFEKAARDGCKVVFASSSSLYNSGPTPSKEDQKILVTDFYTECRLCIERLAELYSDFYNVSSIALRMFSIYGGKRERSKKNFANTVTQWLDMIKDDESPVIYGDGTQSRDFVHIDDAVRAYILAADYETKFEIFNLGMGKDYSFNQVIELLNQKLGKSVEAKYVENPLKNYVAKTLADVSKTQEKLGFKAECTLEQGIGKMIE